MPQIQKIRVKRKRNIVGRPVVVPSQVLVNGQQIVVENEVPAQQIRDVTVPIPEQNVVHVRNEEPVNKNVFISAK